MLPPESKAKSLDDLEKVIVQNWLAVKDTTLRDRSVGPLLAEASVVRPVSSYISDAPSTSWLLSLPDFGGLRERFPRTDNLCSLLWAKMAPRDVGKQIAMLIDKVISPNAEAFVHRWRRSCACGGNCNGKFGICLGGALQGELAVGASSGDF